ncbi:hypothetical protein GGI35DRAFT_296457 [Trichoderma velutinum]
MTEPHTGRELLFLPINQPRSPTGVKNRRTWPSCEGCRKRKCRCEPFEGRAQPCSRCVKEHRNCEVRPRRSGRLGQRHRVVEFDGDTNRSYRHLSEERAPSPNVDSIERRASASSDGGTFNSVRSTIASTELHNTADALELLNTAVNKDQDGCQTQTGHVTSHPSAFIPRLSVDGCSPEQSDEEIVLGRFLLVKKGIISTSEMREYLDYYFKELWPLKPVVPRALLDPTQRMLLIDKEPILMMTLVVISSRYHCLSGSRGELRSERIHYQAWRYLQKYLNTVLWGSSCTRSLGVIASLLLLVEWHSKSFNNPAELSRDLERVVPQGSGTVLRGEDAAISWQDDATVSVGGSKILLPAYRSNKISRTLLSVAISLAHKARCFENSHQGSFQAQPLNQKADQDWPKVLGIFLFLADENLALRLGLEPLLSATARQVVIGRLSTSFASCLENSAMWESYFELYLIHGQARDLVHAFRKECAEKRTPDILSSLEHIERKLDRWKKQQSIDNDGTTTTKMWFMKANGYSEIITPLRYWLDIEYRYALMYSFNPSLHVLRSETDSNGSLSEVQDRNLQTYRRYAQRAGQASHDLLSIVTYSLEPCGLLTLAPVRFWLYIIAASLHLIKTTLVLDLGKEDLQRNSELLHAVITALRRGSPDDIHLAMPFSNHLEKLLSVTLDKYLDRTETRSQEGLQYQVSIEATRVEMDNIDAPGHIPGLNDFDWGILDYQESFQLSCHSSVW